MTMNEKSKIFVSVVCIRNGQDNDLDLAAKLPETQRYLAERYVDHEIVLVLDDSAPATIRESVEAVIAKTPCIRYLQLSSAVNEDVLWAAGLENAIGDVVVLFDLKRDPRALIETGVNQCTNGHDVVVGVAPMRESLPYRLLRPLAAWLLKLADYRLPRHATTFRCISRRAVNAVMQIRRFHQRVFMNIQKTGYVGHELPYELNGTADSKTVRTNMPELARLLMFNSAVPLRLLSLTGLLGSLLAFFAAFFAVVVFFFKKGNVEGWSSTFLLISMLSLFQFIILTFLGEYMKKIMDELSNAQAYAVTYEKNSFVMVDRDRLNVLNRSVDDEVNAVQTGRKA